MIAKKEFSNNLLFFYGAIVTAVLLSLSLVAAGRVTFTAFIGFVFGLLFIGLFVTRIRMFIFGFIALRGLLEFFLEPTRIPIGGTSVQLLGALGVMILVGGFAYVVINKVKIMEMSVIGPMILFLVSTLPVLLFFSPDKEVGFKDWVGVASSVMLFILITNIVNTKKQILQLVNLIIICSIPSLLFGFYQLFTNSGNHETPGFNRINSTFFHPNGYALYLDILLLLCVPLFLETKSKWSRLGYGIMVAAMGVSLVFTYGRTNWLIFLLGLTILAFVRYRQLLIAGPVGIVLMLVLFPTILDRFQEVYGFSQGQGSLFFRVEMWRYLLPRFYDSPLLGNGLGSFVLYAETGLGYYYLPHNDYVRLLVDTGLIGLGCYLAALYGLFKGAVRAHKTLIDESLRVLAMVLIAVIVTNIVGSSTENLFRFGSYQTYFWALAGLVAAATRINYQQQESGERRAAEADEAELSA